MGLRSQNSTLVAVLALFLAASTAGAASARAADRLLADEAWAPPAWTDLATGARRAVDRYADSTAYEAARTDTAFEARQWRYRSDSVEVVALVFRPRAESPRPAIVYCRGSYLQQGLAASFLPLLHRLARAGYFVVAPQYRGSEGGTGRDDMGGADVEDVLEVVRLTAARHDVDRRAIYLYGESRGGMMTFQAIRDGASVRAAATVGAFTDLDSLFSADERSAGMATQIWPDYKSRAREIADRRSAVRWASRIRVPLLILHGENDSGVPPRQSRQLDAALTRVGTPHELRIVPGGSHTLGERSAYRDSLVVSWFGAHRP
jgi:dipeptidyl aminopeptidase/acylaminoacyl peptidase